MTPPRTIKELRKRLPKRWKVAWTLDHDCVPWELYLWRSQNPQLQYNIIPDIVGDKDPACYPAALALAEAVEVRKL